MCSYNAYRHYQHSYIRTPRGENTHIAKITRPIPGLFLAANPLPSEIDLNFKIFFLEYLACPRLVDTNGLAVLEYDKGGCVGRCGRRDECDTDEVRTEGGTKWSRTCRGENAAPAEWNIVIMVKSAESWSTYFASSP